MNTKELTQQIEEVLALAEKATPGPWIADDFCELDGEVRRLGTSDGTDTYYHSTTTIAYFETSTEEGKEWVQELISEPRRKFNCQFAAAAHRMANLLRQVLPMVKDAERYRWLRNPDVDPNLVIDKITGELDAAIDDAIQNQEK